MTIYRSAGPHSRGISPAEITGPGSVLDLVTVLAARCDQFRAGLVAELSILSLTF